MPAMVAYFNLIWPYLVVLRCRLVLHSPTPLEPVPRGGEEGEHARHQEHIEVTSRGSWCHGDSSIFVATLHSACSTAFEVVIPVKIRLFAPVAEGVE